jgi:hypothetical protein
MIASGVEDLFEQTVREDRVRLDVDVKRLGVTLGLVEEGVIVLFEVLDVIGGVLEGGLVGGGNDVNGVDGPAALFGDRARQRDQILFRSWVRERDHHPVGTAVRLDRACRRNGRSRHLIGSVEDVLAQNFSFSALLRA